jgi:hypothetical protein
VKANNITRSRGVKCSCSRLSPLTAVSTPKAARPWRSVFLLASCFANAVHHVIQITEYRHPKLLIHVSTIYTWRITSSYFNYFLLVPATHRRQRKQTCQTSYGLCCTTRSDQADPLSLNYAIHVGVARHSPELPTIISPIRLLNRSFRRRLTHQKKSQASFAAS